MPLFPINPERKMIRDDWLSVREVGPYIIATLHPDEVYPIVRAGVPLRERPDVKVDLVNVNGEIKPKRFIFPKRPGLNYRKVWSMHDLLVKSWDQCVLCEEYKKKLSPTPIMAGDVLSAAARGAVANAVAAFAGKVAGAVVDRAMGTTHAENEESRAEPERASGESTLKPAETAPRSPSNVSLSPADRALLAMAKKEAVKAFARSVGIELD